MVTTGHLHNKIEMNCVEKKNKKKNLQSSCAVMLEIPQEFLTLKPPGCTSFVACRSTFFPSFAGTAGSPDCFFWSPPAEYLYEAWWRLHWLNSTCKLGLSQYNSATIKQRYLSDQETAMESLFYSSHMDWVKHTWQSATQLNKK